MKTLGWQRGQDGIWHKGNQRFSVSLTYNHEIYTGHLSLLREEAKKAGIEIILDFLDGSAAYKKIMEKKHQAAFIAWGTGLIPEPWQFFHSVNAKPNTNNVTNTVNQKMDDLIDKYRETTDQAQHIRLAHEIAQHVYELGDFIPSHYFPFVRACHWRWMRLPEEGAATLLSQQVFNPTGSATGGLFWIDEAMKKATLSAKKKGEGFAPVSRMENKPTSTNTPTQ